MRFRFKTNDKLPYNKKINVPVCVVSKRVSRVIKKGDCGIIHRLIYKNVFMKMIIFEKKVN